MDEKRLKKERRVKEDLAFKAGGGVWFRKDDYQQVQVDVTFHPATKLWLIDGAERRPITLAELQRDYERLRL